MQPRLRAAFFVGSDIAGYLTRPGRRRGPRKVAR